MNFPELMNTVESSTSIELMRLGLIKSSVRVKVTLDQCSSNVFHRDPFCTGKFFRDP